MNKPDHQITIHIDRKPYKVDAEHLTGRQMRALPNPDISALYELKLDVPGGTDTVVGDDDPVELRNWQHFYSVQRNTNPG